jgi:oligopeptide/dipeptide ABC transporter ATP-binding protein
MITHDLGVVAGMCERVHVMYGGMLVETATADEVFARPRHPYTFGLLQSVPRLDMGRRQKLRPIEGQPRNVLAELASCPFAPRCRNRIEHCDEERPPLEPIGEAHEIACFNPVPADAWRLERTGGAA